MRDHWVAVNPKHIPEQGNRVKISRGNEACEPVVIPPGGFLPAAQ